jgi:hypothetical protein
MRTLALMLVRGRRECLGMLCQPAGLKVMSVIVYYLIGKV